MTTGTECPADTVTAWPAKGARVGYCPECGREFRAPRGASVVGIPPHPSRVASAAVLAAAAALKQNR